MPETQRDAEHIVNIPPAELADRLERLSASSARKLLLSYPIDQVAAVLSELEPKKAAELIDENDDPALFSALQLLTANRIADILPDLSASTQAAVLAQLPPDLSKAAQALARFPTDTAGGVMDNRFIALEAIETVSEVLDRLRGQPRGSDVTYLYVIDSSQHLIGVVSFRDLVFNPADVRVSAIMNPHVQYLKVTDDQEEISKKMQQYPYLGFPVVDDDDRLVGVVRFRDAVRVAQSEATEDMQLMVGLSGEERIWTPWKHSIAKRLPWLGVNLITALGAATVASLFEETIARWTALVAFLPLICAVAGNAGNQALTVIIRSMALGEVSPGDGMRTLRKELLIGAANGLVLALAIALIAIGWKQSAILGLVAGAAMLLNQMIGALAGVAVPFGLKQFKIDPALASSILVTALTDTMGFFVFLTAATLAIRFLIL